MKCEGKCLSLLQMKPFQVLWLLKIAEESEAPHQTANQYNDSVEWIM